jgi:hypothetical protein
VRFVRVTKKRDYIPNREKDKEHWDSCKSLQDSQKHEEIESQCREK